MAHRGLLTKPVQAGSSELSGMCELRKKGEADRDGQATHETNFQPIAAHS